MTDLGFEKFLEWIIEEVAQYNYDFESLREDFGKDVAKRVALQLCPATRRRGLEWNMTQKSLRTWALNDCLKRDAASDWDDDGEVPALPAKRPKKSQG